MNNEKREKPQPFYNHGLNKINIDNERGNWTASFSENGHGTYPPCGLWLQVTQVDSTHMIYQIGKYISGVTSGTYENDKIYVRSKWSNGIWSEWTRLCPLKIVTASTDDLKNIWDDSPLFFLDNTKWFTGIRIPNHRGYVEFYTKFDGSDFTVKCRKYLDGVYYGDW